MEEAPESEKADQGEGFVRGELRFYRGLARSFAPWVLTGFLLGFAVGFFLAKDGLLKSPKDGLEFGFFGYFVWLTVKGVKKIFND